MTSFDLAYKLKELAEKGLGEESFGDHFADGKRMGDGNMDNDKATQDSTLVSALRILARDIDSEDGVANAVIAEAADRIEDLAAEPMRLEDAWSHVKALWPDADCIIKKDDMVLTDVVRRGDSIGQAVSLRFTNIAWPEGVTRYPESA